MVDPLPVNNSFYVKALYRQKISTGKYKRHLRNIHYIIFLEINYFLTNDMIQKTVAFS